MSISTTINIVRSTYKPLFPSPQEKWEGHVRRFPLSSQSLPLVPVGMFEIMIDQDNFPVRARSSLKDIFSPLSVA